MKKRRGSSKVRAATGHSRAVYRVHRIQGTEYLCTPCCLSTSLPSLAVVSSSLEACALARVRNFRGFSCPNF